MRSCLRLGVIALTIATTVALSPAQRNGIAFGAAREFDERTLFERFRRIQVALTSMGVPLDKSLVLAGLGKVQGASANASTSQLGLSLQLPIASFTSTNTNGTTAATTTNGTAAPTTSTGSSQSNQNTSTLQQSPVTAPELKAPIVSNGLAMPSQTYSIGAADLLSEQTQLSFQLTNLSLLLDRSISDRVKFDTDESTSGVTPRSFVVGIDITVSPKYKDAVAEVVIEACPVGDKIEPIKVATLMPYEKTYNVATYASKTTGFSLGTVFQVIGISASTQNQNSHFYLARDLDTIGMHFPSDRQKGTNPATRFGWQFRPSLNRRVVEGGTRQVFAVLTMPAWQGITPDNKPLEVRLVAKTRWFQYDRGKNLVGKPLSSCETVPLETLKVFPAKLIADSLAPKLLARDMSVSDAGDGNVLITAKGENFFPGTTVSVGHVVQAPADSFSVPSELEIRFQTSVNDLLTKDPTVVGPYGASQSLRNISPGLNLSLSSDPPIIMPLNAQTSLVTISLTASGNQKKPPELAGSPGMFRANTFIQVKDPEGNEMVLPEKTAPMVVVLGGRAYGLSDRPIQVVNKDGKYVISFMVLTESLRSQTEFSIVPLIHLFQKPYRFDINVPHSIFVDGIAVNQVGADAFFTLRTAGMNTDEVTLIVGGSEIKPHYPTGTVKNANVIVFKASAAVLEGLKSVTLKRAGLIPLELSLEAAPKPKTTVTAIGKATLNQAVPLTVTGTSLDKVSGVTTSDNETLDWYFDAQAKEFKIVPTTKVVDKAKTVTLIFKVEGGASIRFPLVVGDPN